MESSEKFMIKKIIAINLQSQQGAFNLILVLFMAVVAAFIIATIESRLLLSIYRTKSFSDNILANYDAESVLYDLLARIKGDYDINVNDYNSSTIQVVESSDAGNQIFSITATRPFSVFKIEAVKTNESVVTPGKADIIMSLDCTGSMVLNKACPSCIETRLYYLRESAISFIDQLIGARDDGADVRLGLVGFGLNAAWVRTLNDTGPQITPTSGVSLEEIRTTIQNGYDLKPDGSWSAGTNVEMVDMPLCRRDSPISITEDVLQSTSIGSALVFSHDYFSVNTELDRKQIEIVITDGDPNARIPYPACPASLVCVPNDKAYACKPPIGFSSLAPYTCSTSYDSDAECLQPGRNFMQCALATSDAAPAPPIPGIRNPEVDAYLVTVQETVNATVENILSTYSTQYLKLANSTQLFSAVDQIFTNISTSIPSQVSWRVIP